MKTSRRKYNEQYRLGRLYVDGFFNPKIVAYCTEHTRCETCGSHVKLTGFNGHEDGWLFVYECPTCGKCYGVVHEEHCEEDEICLA